MRSALNPKKLALCRTIGARPYETASVRGGDGHQGAVCQWRETDGSYSSDVVDYRARTVTPIVRRGQFLRRKPYAAPTARML